MTKIFKIAPFAAAAAVAMTFASPATAAELPATAPATPHFAMPMSPLATGEAETAQHHRRWHNPPGHRRNGRSGRYYDDRRYYGERVTRRTRVWQGRDGRYYCRKEDGTTGLLIGAAVGALAGRELARDRTLGAVIGAAVGGLAGREIDRSDSRCR